MLLAGKDDDKLDNLILLNGLYNLTGGEGSISTIVGPKIKKEWDSSWKNNIGNFSVEMKLIK